MVIVYCRSDSYGSYNCLNKKISLKNAKPSPVTVLKEEIKMTRNEARSAFHTAVPVMCGGIEYVCISAIIYRYRRFLRAPPKRLKSETVFIFNKDVFGIIIPRN